MPKRGGSPSGHRRRVGSPRRPMRRIDYSGIPNASSEQLKAMRRAGRRAGTKDVCD